jgi:hypothetical protein
LLRLPPNTTYSKYEVDFSFWARNGGPYGGFELGLRHFPPQKIAHALEFRRDLQGMIGDDSVIDRMRHGELADLPRMLRETRAIIEKSCKLVERTQRFIHMPAKQTRPEDKNGSIGF